MFAPGLAFMLFVTGSDNQLLEMRTQFFPIGLEMMVKPLHPQRRTVRQDGPRGGASLSGSQSGTAAGPVSTLCHPCPLPVPKGPTYSHPPSPSPPGGLAHFTDG